ncbi:hypothetical protein ACFFQF_30755 [Haladaptatus pallidirubidus]|uniref:Uncharacterized protein n=1 Tax=Haladaptatus pallidirubidus TaxID=1008152 RepID=A0AAV3UHU6_9EURY|nr:hypothetical protein [Haladaptatus pallidirubidus]
MIGIESFSGSAQAVATVGIVFAEAIMLYAGYGALTGVVGSTVLETLEGE